MYKFEVDDEVRVVNHQKGSLIPIGTCGKIIRRFLDLNWGSSYILTIAGIREEITFGEQELESELTKATRQPKRDETSSPNPDFEKRVSETRDNLLRDIFN